jgi:hypothetical protein
MVPGGSLTMPPASGSASTAACTESNSEASTATGLESWVQARAGKKERRTSREWKNERFMDPRYHFRPAGIDTQLREIGIESILICRDE